MMIVDKTSHHVLDLTDNDIVKIRVRGRSEKCIGRILRPENRNYKIYRKKNVRVFLLKRSVPSYGVSVPVLENLLEDKDRVWFDDYYLTKERILEIGTYLWYKDKGCEKQIFVPLSQWNIN